MASLSSTSVFESLASAVRLDIYRLLVKTGPDGLVAGEIASTLNVPPTNLSFHLKALTHAQLVSVVQEALSNVLQHSGATKVDINVRYLPATDLWQAEVCDNGRGLDVQQLAHCSGTGIAGMQQRAAGGGATGAVVPTRRGHPRAGKCAGG